MKLSLCPILIIALLLLSSCKSEPLAKLCQKRDVDLPKGFSQMMEFFQVDLDGVAPLDYISAGLVLPATYPASKTPLKALVSDKAFKFNEFQSSELKDVVHIRHSTMIDFNNDGRLDFLLADHGTDVAPFPGGYPKLYSRSDMGLIDRSKALNIKKPLFNFHIISGDIDNDGDEDILLSNFGENESPQILFNYNGNFKYVPKALPRFKSTHFLAAHFVDIDNDNDLDLILGGGDKGVGGSADLILINDGRGIYKKSLNALPPRAKGSDWGSVSISSSDFNRDGYQDLLILSHDPKLKEGMAKVYLNHKNLKFREASLEGIDFKNNFWLPWARIGDMDLDGFDDIFIQIRASSNKQVSKAFLFYKNQKGKGFKLSNDLYPDFKKSFTSIFLEDRDNDNDLDLLLFGHDGKLVICENPTR